MSNSYELFDAVVGDPKAGSDFDDTQYLPQGTTIKSISSIAVRYGWYIDALDVVYTLSNGEPRSTGHGGWGDNTNIQNWSYNFGKGEQLLKVEARGGPGKHVNLLRLHVGTNGKITKVFPSENGWFGDKNKGSGDIVTVDKEVVAFAGTQSDYIESLRFYVKK